ncbi:MAG: hypothetical protein ACR2IF_05235 [Terriglobales bacterium]
MRLSDCKNEFRSACSFNICRGEQTLGALRDQMDNLERLGGAAAAEEIVAAKLAAAYVALQLDEAIAHLGRLKDAVRDVAGKRALEEAAKPAVFRR